MLSTVMEMVRLWESCEEGSCWVRWDRELDTRMPTPFVVDVALW